MHVLVAMSGGVDSSVTAAILRDDGHRVTGFTFMIAGYDAEKVNRSIRDARRVAAHLGIPHYVTDVTDQFTCSVVEPFVQEYARGRTPNPCTICNRVLKFKLLLDAARDIGADAVATGHYARIERDDSNLCHLKTGIDSSRDQSYFLFNLSQAQLQRSIFPLGDWHKSAIRKKADLLKLPVADKPDSQEICFIPHDDYSRFIKEKYPHTLKPGDIVDTKGIYLGSHPGIQFYTIGQRKGIGAHAGRKYVVRIDAANNRIVIGDNDDLFRSELRLRHCNWIVPPSASEFRAAAKIRSTSPPALCTVICNPDYITLRFDQPQRAITPGQAGVVYLADELLGGGFIDPLS